MLVIVQAEERGLHQQVCKPAQILEGCDGLGVLQRLGTERLGLALGSSLDVGGRSLRTRRAAAHVLCARPCRRLSGNGCSSAARHATPRPCGIPSIVGAAFC